VIDQKSEFQSNFEDAADEEPMEPRPESDSEEITVKLRREACRWCDRIYTIENSTERGGIVEDSAQDCPKCAASQDPIIELVKPSGAFRFYHNPDMSLYLEYIKGDGKTGRYELPSDYLLERNLLRYFDADPRGKKDV